MLNIIGLNNINSIFYLNSIIQSLISCKSFVKWVLQNKEVFINEKNQIGILFYNIIKKIQNDVDLNNENYILSKKLNFEDQNCAHEALLLIIDKLNIENIFKIKYNTYKHCNECNNTTRVEAIDLVTYDYYFSDKDDFTESINNEVEPIDDCECEFCKKKTSQKLIKKVIESNDVFVVMFKQYNSKKNYKYDNILLLNNMIYKLKAKICHIGNLNGGHYWVTRYIGSKILKINDENITELDSDIVDEYTYMLFYQKI